MDFTGFRALSFDCYGTLIDWESGILAVLRPWAAERGISVDDGRLLAAFGDAEAAIQRDQPTLRYSEVLAETFRRVGGVLDAGVSDEWADRLGRSVGDWPAFDDSSAALAALAEHFQLIIVSNVHRDGFAASNRKLQGRFAAIITAEDVGGYKPADAHFDELDRTIAGLGIDRSELLHVAQSLFHDHGPARRRGMRSVWINRRGGRIGTGASATGSTEPDIAASDYAFEAEFASMRDFAAAVDASFDHS